MPRSGPHRVAPLDGLIAELALVSNTVPNEHWFCCEPTSWVRSTSPTRRVVHEEVSEMDEKYLAARRV